MEIRDHVRILKLTQGVMTGTEDGFYSVVWIIGNVEGIEVDHYKFDHINNTMFFLTSGFQWKILTNDFNPPVGYILSLSDTILNEPFLKGLQINEMRVLYAQSIHKAKIIPEIQKRLLSILEMMEELLNTRLKHREEAILALIHTFFVFCDGQCNITPSRHNHSSKVELAYKFVRLLGDQVTQNQKVSVYATELNVSAAYLNECIHEVLGVSAKSLIIKQMVLRTQKALRFTDHSVKQIAYELGFSSPDYFSSFCKKHMGQSPSDFKNE